MEKQLNGFEWCIKKILILFLKSMFKGEFRNEFSEQGFRETQKDLLK